MHLRTAASIALFSLSVAALPAAIHAQEEEAPVRHGRKYKAPPETSHLEVVVIKRATGKPIVNAAVVFHSSKDGKDEGNMEVKTDPDGRAKIDVIPTGSNVRVQVIANGFATFADEYVLDGPSKEISVAMLRPQEQVSAYEDNDGKASGRKAGVQEPVKPKATPKTPGKPTVPVSPTSPSQPQSSQPQSSEPRH